jgi:hypothetical protein
MPPTSVTINLTRFTLTKNLKTTATLQFPSETFSIGVTVKVSGGTHGVREVKTGGDIRNPHGRLFDFTETGEVPNNIFKGYSVLVPVEQDDTGIIATFIIFAEAGGAFTTDPPATIIIAMHFDGAQWYIDPPADSVKLHDGTVEHTSGNVVVTKESHGRSGEADVRSEYDYKPEPGNHPSFSGTLYFSI